MVVLFQNQSGMGILLIDNYHRSLENKLQKDRLDRPGLKSFLNRTLEKKIRILCYRLQLDIKLQIMVLKHRQCLTKTFFVVFNVSKSDLYLDIVKCE